LQETLLITILGVIAFGALVYLAYVTNNFFKYFLAVMKEINEEKKNQ
tara:strand:- start:50 stop:190 length:141 start_codon:yes stop_codon:yes gene_type:complete